MTEFTETHSQTASNKNKFFLELFAIGIAFCTFWCLISGVLGQAQNKGFFNELSFIGLGVLAFYGISIFFAWLISE